jgi:ABC-type glutathione transport system ATPase component
VSRGRAAAVAIECDGISLTYSAKSGNPIEALRRVSFRMAPHRVTAVASGCGKTPLQIIRGLLVPMDKFALLTKSQEGYAQQPSNGSSLAGSTCFVADRRPKRVGLEWAV